jgi:hypothetical protein
MFERDYILRLIEQASQAVARALRLLILDQPDEAERELAAGYAALGMDREMLCVLEGRTIRNFFGNGEEKLVLAMRVLLCEIELEKKRSGVRGATRLLRAAQKIFDQIAQPPAELSAELKRSVKSLE